MQWNGESRKHEQLNEIELLDACLLSWPSRVVVAVTFIILRLLYSMFMWKKREEKKTFERDPTSFCPFKTDITSWHVKIAQAFFQCHFQYKSAPLRQYFHCIYRLCILSTVRADKKKRNDFTIEHFTWVFTNAQKHKWRTHCDSSFLPVFFPFSTVFLKWQHIL